MIDFDSTFEQKCEEYLLYLTELGAQKYSDCPDIDSLIQDAMMAFIIKKNKGEEIDHPKGFLSAILRNKHNMWLRKKYKSNISVYDFSDILEGENEFLQKEESELRNKEYESVRREIGRLIRIYREVTVRHYIHGHSVERIAKELGISQGTVKSRLSSARDQIKEGLEKMEKYSNVSYEPKGVGIGVWGSMGLSGEPGSLIHSDIEGNILYLAYEKPISAKEIADTMGMPCAYIEPLIDRLIEGELMGKTAGGLVYTRCFMQRYEDVFGDIDAQETLAEKYVNKVWEIVWKNIEPLTTHDEFTAMTEKQKATMLLFVLQNCVGGVIGSCNPVKYSEMKIPERPNGKWLGVATVFDRSEKHLDKKKYGRSGPVHVLYGKNNDGNFDCRMFDFQSVFGDAHWGYNRFKYRCNLQDVLRFYASLLETDVRPDNNFFAELVPDFEKMHIVRREDNGEIKLDVPALTFEEGKHWDVAMAKIEDELFELLNEELTAIWNSRTNKVPKYVDGREYFLHENALSAYTVAQMLSIVNHNLLPYYVEIGKTPIIYILYKKKEA